MRILLTNCQTKDGNKNILIEKDFIKYVGKEIPENDRLLDCSNLLVLPGMIDSHVHVRDMEMGYKETWETASAAAISGGVTSIVDMPNTIPPTTNLQGLNKKREAASKANVNYKFHLGATDNNLKELREILKENTNDIAGIKVFLAGSSSNEVVKSILRLKEIFQLAKEFDKIVLVHSELQQCLDKWQKKIEDKTILNHQLIRNRECVVKGTEHILKLAEEIGNKLYICHVSTKEEIELIRKSKQENKNIFCEVTPHHLTLDKEILEYVGNFGKVNPPLRTTEDNRVLWEAVLDGTIDCIGSDHAPHTIDEKIEDYSNAPSGFPGLETTLPILLTEFQKKNISVNKFVKLISENASRLFNFEKRGAIKEGNFADLIVVNTEREFPIIASLFNSKAKYSPFDGSVAKAFVEKVFVNGKLYEN